MKLEPIYRKLIRENVSRLRVEDAIENKEIIKIYYAGDHIIHKGWRHIEPYCYGTSKADNPIIRAWQRKGVTDTPENHPGWRTFRLDRIHAWNITGDYFRRPRPKYNPDDKDMKQIYKAAYFAPGTPVNKGNFADKVKGFFKRMFK